MLKAVTSGAALFARLGLKPKSMSTAGRALYEGLKQHGTVIGTAATVASLVPSGSRGQGSAASNSEASSHINRFKAARRR
ncbi:MAG: hypothetical protein AAF449_23940 [Myxococcota bacterium]